MNNKNIFTIEQIINEINLNLEDIAKSIVAKEIFIEKNNLIKLYKQQFFFEIDCNRQHKYNWHQWGIVTHSRACMSLYDNEVKNYLKEWDKLEVIEKHLNEKIDGITKSKLIYIGILLHDLGKFKKHYTIEPNHKVKCSFSQHEVYSQKIILEDIYPLLHEYYKLSRNQIKYIATCAENHGLVRQIIKKAGINYSSEFIHSDKFKNILLNELSELKKYKIEIGLLFFADSCAKTNIAFQDRTDIDILEDLRKQNLNQKLIKAVKQKEQSIKVAQHYFEIIL